MPLSNAEKLLYDFCKAEQLPENYSAMAADYFLPLAESLSKGSEPQQQPLLIGINGCQGSGKSTLAALLTQLLTQLYSHRVCNLSIDDFYLTLAERESLAQEVHPLLKTRGVPGTHDIHLLTHTIKSLRAQENSVAIPRFNKAVDDRLPESEWDHQGPVDIILLEGWCVGVQAEPKNTLSKPVNTLESQEDSQGIWRHYVNQMTRQYYGPLFKTLDQLIMLAAPSFQCVFDWRTKQEQKLAASLSAGESHSGVMNTRQLARFIDHYQRLTEQMLLTLPKQANITFILDKQHTITGCINNG